MKILAPLLALSALGACAGINRPAESGTVEASVANSEWTQSGYVTLDLRTGRYRLRHQRSRLAPTAPVPTTTGRLAEAELQPLRSAYAAARAEGLIEPVCRNGGPPPQIIVSNAGPMQLVLNPDGARSEAPSERGCWTAAATELHRLLDTTFEARARPAR